MEIFKEKSDEKLYFYRANTPEENEKYFNSRDFEIWLLLAQGKSIELVSGKKY